MKKKKHASLSLSLSLSLRRTYASPCRRRSTRARRRVCKPTSRTTPRSTSCSSRARLKRRTATHTRERQQDALSLSSFHFLLLPFSFSCFETRTLRRSPRSRRSWRLCARRRRRNASSTRHASRRGSARVLPRYIYIYIYPFQDIHPFDENHISSSGETHISFSNIQLHFITRARGTPNPGLARPVHLADYPRRSPALTCAPFACATRHSSEQRLALFRERARACAC